MASLISSKGITKMQAIMLSAVIIIAAVAGASYLSFFNVPKKSETIILGSTDSVSKLDPVQLKSIPLGSPIVYYIFDPLYRFKPESTELEPCLATSYTLVNPKTWEFTLREDVRFHDGTPFNASCVKYHFERGEELGLGNVFYYVPWIESIEVVDTYKVRFHTPVAFSPLLKLISSYLGCIVSPTAAQKLGSEDFATNPVGSGPWKFKSWTSDDELVLEANKEYWNAEEIPRSDEFVIKFFGDESTLKMSLERGDIDLAYRHISTPDIPSLKENPDVDVIEQKWVGNAMTIILNLLPQHYPINNSKVRQAIAYGIDYEKLIDVGMHGEAKRIYTWIDPGWTSTYPAFAKYSYDPSRAAELLTEAGHPEGGFKITFTYSTSYGEEMNEVAAIIQSNLGDIGIDVELRSIDSTTMFSERRKGILQFWMCGPAASYPDAFQLTEYYCHVNGSYPMCHGYNMTYYDPITNPIHVQEVSNLIDQALIESDEGNRDYLYQEVQRLTIGEDVLYIPLFYRTNYIFVRANVKGLVVGPIMYTLNFASLYKES